MTTTQVAQWGCINGWQKEQDQVTTHMPKLKTIIFGADMGKTTLIPLPTALLDTAQMMNVVNAQNRAYLLID